MWHEGLDLYLICGSWYAPTVSAGSRDSLPLFGSCFCVAGDRRGQRSCRRENRTVTSATRWCLSMRTRLMGSRKFPGRCPRALCSQAVRVPTFIVRTRRCCSECGAVLSEVAFSSDVQFTKDASGAAAPSTRFVRDGATISGRVGRDGREYGPSVSDAPFTCVVPYVVTMLHRFTVWQTGPGQLFCA